MGDTLQLELLGHFQLRHGEAPVALASGHSQALLAYLALYRHTPQPRQRVAAHFWPDSSETQARTNLRRELHHLKQVLPEADTFLDLDAQGLSWRVGVVALDVATFEASLREANETEGRLRSLWLERAVACYRGELLPALCDE